MLMANLGGGGHWRRAAALLFFPLALAAQPVLSLSGTGPVSITLSGSGATGMDMFQFSLTVPPGATAVPGPSAPASKQLSCFVPASSSVMTCVLWGFDPTRLADGVVVMVAAPSWPVGTYPLFAALGSSPATETIPIPDASLVIAPTFSPCDVNRDGKTDSADAKTIVDAIVSATPNIPPPIALDLTGDKKVDIRDVQRVVNAIQPQGACKVGP